MGCAARLSVRLGVMAGGSPELLWQGPQSLAAGMEVGSLGAILCCCPALGALYGPCRSNGSLWKETVWKVKFTLGPLRPDRSLSVQRTTHKFGKPPRSN